MNIKKIAVAITALMLVSACPISTDKCTLDIESYAAETVLSAPYNVKAKVKNNTVSLSWDKVDGADAYRIYKYDAVKKKYVKHKSITGNKIVIKNLEEGSYKFKIAALTKNGKSYKVGNTSKAITVKIQTSSKESKTKLKEAALSAKEMAGAWDFYDFRYRTDISKSNTYDPSKKEWYDSNYMTTLQFVSEKNVLIGYSDFYEKAEFNTSSKKIETTETTPYKVLTDGTDYYLFLEFENGDGKNTYIFKKKALPDLKRVNDIKLLSGKWVATDFCECELNPNITYDPTSPLYPGDLYLTKANVTGKEITMYFSEGGQRKFDITADKIGDAKYYVFSVGDDMYMYYLWVNGDGDGQFYVLKKEKV